MYPLPTNPNTPMYLVEPRSYIDSMITTRDKFRSLKTNWQNHYGHQSLTLMSSFKLFPLKSKYVNELEMLWFNDNECAIWLTPFAVRPQCDNDRRHNPLEIFAIGPARWTAPTKNKLKRAGEKKTGNEFLLVKNENIFAFGNDKKWALC